PTFVDTDVAVARNAGMRLHLVRGSITAMEIDLEQHLSSALGAKAGGVVDDPAAVLSDMRRTIQKYHDETPGSMVTVALGPTTVTYSDLEYLKSVVRLASDTGVGLHMHLHPMPAERDLCREQFASTPVKILERVGFLGPGTWLAHSTRINSDDMTLLGDRGVG